MYKILIFSFFIFFSCKGRQKETQISTLDKNITAVNDSLREPNHYQYLADLTPKQFAELIMKDSIRPSDNFITFRVMDSLNAKSIEDRKFYFKVFLNIMKKSDGALAEAMGLTAYDYVEKHTKEFFELSLTITKKQFELWANNVGVEIYLSSLNNPTKDAEKYFNKLRENCSLEQKNEVEKFCEIIRETITVESN